MLWITVYCTHFLSFVLLNKLIGPAIAANIKKSQVCTSSIESCWPSVFCGHIAHKPIKKKNCILTDTYGVCVCFCMIKQRLELCAVIW
uniref:Secreted protein n=1 Tax=Pyxicephalus adspersus TaxID=30357 RepID=A0AAV3AA89_PYXAD|nr:TPA: hypothetical protein GDO54_017848 [Pyxicephalus adspersus]